MSDEFAAIRSHIPEYAGHDDVVARRLSDQQVRAFLGEALISLRERLATGDGPPGFEDLVYHCQFGDQRLIKRIEDDRFSGAGPAERLDAENLALIEAALRAASVTSKDAAAFVDDVAGLMARRVETAVAHPL